MPARDALHSLLRVAYQGVNPPVRWAKWRLLGVQHARLGRFPTRLALLDSACGVAPADGLWMEFGVWKGESIDRIARHTSHRVYGFDSFEGLPEEWGPAFPKGAFSLGGRLPAVGPNVVLVPGWFEETLPGFLQQHPDEPVTFVHIDCDLYRSTRTIFDHLARRLRDGTVLVFDEFCTLQPDDESRAFRELIRTTGRRFEYLGSSTDGFGSVAVRLGA